MAYMEKVWRKDTLPVSVDTVSRTHSDERKNRKRNVAFRPPLISKPELLLLLLSIAAPPLPIDRPRDRITATRFPSTVSCLRLRGRGEKDPRRATSAAVAVALTYLGLSFPREHSCWNLRLSASSTALVFHSCRTYFT